MISARIMTSTWSLHRKLGQVMYQWPDPKRVLVADEVAQGEISLLEVPTLLAARGISALEICHFHFPRLDPGYLGELRQVLEASGVELFSILIDAGDITHPDSVQREKEIAWIRAWMEIAARCGARAVRVIAGDAVAGERGEWCNSELVQLSAEKLRALAEFGRGLGLAVLTENFRALALSVGALTAILDLCEDEVGLCADFGNFKGPNKYRDLAQILPRATSVHAKADFLSPGQMDRADFTRCLSLAQKSGFAGPYSLIFSSPGDEWEGIGLTRKVVEEWL